MNYYTESNQLISPNPKGWSEQIKEYTNNKKQQAWNNISYPMKLSHKDINIRDNIFNPISQRYYDNQINDSIHHNEKHKIYNQISKNYDHELRNEQTYDVINLQDKFRKFESHPNYPISKSMHIKQNKEISKAPYNIISNHSLQYHHYNSPEKRPLCLSEGNLSDIKYKNQGRDYNIINNRYCNNHDEKIATEKEIKRYAAARNFLNKQSYNLIKGIYFDNEKEAEYQLKKEEISKNWAMNHHQYQSPLYNPVTHQIYNKRKLEEYDQKQLNRRKRYELRNDIEDYYRKIDYVRDLKNEREKDNRVSYFNYKLADERGYDILNYQNTFNKYKDKVGANNKKHMKSNWEILTEQSGNNQTFTTKKIYKSKYDTSDININKHLYDQYRLKKLKNLPLMENDVLFNQRIPFKSKLMNKQ